MKSLSWNVFFRVCRKLLRQMLDFDFHVVDLSQQIDIRHNTNLIISLKEENSFNNFQSFP